MSPRQVNNNCRVVTTSPQDSISNSITSAQARLLLLLKLANDLLEQTSDLKATVLPQVMLMLMKDTERVATSVKKLPASCVLPARWMGLFGTLLRTESLQQAWGQCTLA